MMKTISIKGIIISFFFLIHFSFPAFSQTTQKGNSSHRNLIFNENQLPGTTHWKLTNPATKLEIEGYASATSVASGDTLQLLVNTYASQFSYEIYRMGWYQSLGGRLISKAITVDGMAQKIPKPDKTTGLIECNWKHPLNLPIENNWLTGVYLVKLEEKSSLKQSYIIFVVRNDHVSSDILFQLPVTTYQAYNYWGGKSLYNWGSGESLPWGSSEGTAAVKVSFDRPYALNTNTQVAHTVGSGEFFANFQPVSRGYPISSAGWNYNMLRWLEKEGYDVSYCTNIDTHRLPEELKIHKLFLSNGHDEYWTKEMRDHITKIRDQGVNLAFFGANNMYWQHRFESNSTKTKLDRIMVCYKDKNSDPDKSIVSTVMFREEPISNPESKLLGVQFFSEPVDGDIVITNDAHQLFKGTNLKNGNLLKGLLGYEVDGVTANSPSNIEILASSKALYNKPKIVKTRVKRAILSISILWFILINILCLFILYRLFKWFAYKKWLISKLVFSIIMLGALAVAIFSVNQYYDFNKKHYSHITIYKAKSGAKVFSTGSIQWSWGLDDYGAPELRTSRKNKNAEIITKNVLEMFGAKHKKK